MKKYFGIEILRFFTSLSVLFYHYRHFFSPFNSTSSIDYKETFVYLPFSDFLNVFYQYGIYGVHVFYAISGFVFAHVYLSKEKLITSREFFLNRFARLYPLHFATLIIITVLQFISLFHFKSFQIVEFNDLYHFFLHLFFVSSWGFEQGHSFNAPIWSVSIEIAIYIIFFLTLSLLRRYKFIFVIILSIFLILLAKIFNIESLFLECARLFFSGVIVYLITTYFNKPKILILISLIMIAASFVGNYKTYLFCPFAVLLFSQIDYFIKTKSIQNLFSSLGDLTYSIYLIHVPLQILIIINFDIFNLSETVYATKTFFIFFMILLMIISYFCFLKYEKPLNYKIRKKFK